MTKFEHVGYWWNAATFEIELMRIDGIVYALNGWNGEEFTECWVCTGENYHYVGENEKYTIRPVDKEIGEDEYEITGYDVREN
jgi:hypothetical protein